VRDADTADGVDTRDRTVAGSAPAAAYDERTAARDQRVVADDAGVAQDEHAAARHEQAAVQHEQAAQQQQAAAADQQAAARAHDDGDVVDREHPVDPAAERRDTETGRRV
jgi:hypothetical protein